MYMIRTISFFVGIFLLSFIITSPIVIAQTTSGTLKEQRQNILEQRKETRDVMQEKRTNLRERVKEKRQEARERFKLQKEEFKQRLSQIRDEKKKLVVERIDNKLSTVNTNRTSKMSEHLDKLASILITIKEKAKAASDAGKDTKAANAAIINAEAAIAAAETAVETQAGKEYVITVNDETTLRSTVGITTSQLQADLQATHKLVVDAKQKVQTAARLVAQIIGEGKATSTSSAEQQ